MTGSDDLLIVLEPRPGGRIFERTRVDIEHRGWEVLGADGETWRDRNRGGWATLLPRYVDAVAAAPGELEGSRG